MRTRPLFATPDGKRVRCLNLIPTKKLALLSAAFCAAMLAFSQNASAVTVLGFQDEHILGAATLGAPIPISDADKTGLINHLIGQALNTVEPAFIDGGLYEIGRSNNDFGPLPEPAVIGPSGTTTSITIGSGIYSYVFVTYASLFVAVHDVWYIGNLSGDITIPGGSGDLLLTGWTLFGPGVPAVPDGGTTVMLLGTALGALGMARRFLKV
jgi:hypothetical protein